MRRNLVCVSTKGTKEHSHERTKQEGLARVGAVFVEKMHGYHIEFMGQRTAGNSLRHLQKINNVFQHHLC